MSLLHEAAIYLVAAVVTVPIFKRLGLGSVLGYLVAGCVIGPSGLRFIASADNVLHFAEFGVVLLLFIIGLELEPERLWKLRRAVFGIGGAQIAGSLVLLGGAALLLGQSLPASIVAGFALALSSTALAVQLLTEKHELQLDHGRTAFGILLFQDLAVIPFLALLPLLGTTQAESTDPVWLSVAKVVGVLAGLFIAGRYVLRPMFRFVAGLHSQELFTATALLVVVGTALLMELVGLSMALGAFVAGVLLATSEYRHELEADIEPFKGLLLGLFFIAVGMTVNLALVASRPLVLIALVVGLVALKALVLFGVGKLAKLDNASSLKLAAIASQGGEFAFVLFNLALGSNIMPREQVELLVAVVSVSMATTPFLVIAYEKLLAPKLTRTVVREFDSSDKEAAPVIIAGFGRVGQVVGRMLRAHRIRFTALDKSAEHVDFLQKFGNKLYYGDASRLDLLRAAKAEEARIFVLAVDDIDSSLRIAKSVQEHFPNLTIYARARNRQHVYRLLEMGITRIFRETFSASLELTVDVLKGLGMSESRAAASAERFRAFDEQMVQDTYKHARDIDKLRELAKKANQELEEIFERDARGAA